MVAVICVACLGSNEKQRGRIGKKIDNTPPDSLPDLRDLALLTAVALLCFLPLLLKEGQDSFGMFRLDEQPGPFAWLWFLLDKTYLRALPDAIDLGFTRVERLHEGGIDYQLGQQGYAGRGLVMFAYTLLYLVLVQGLLRLWQIHRDIKEGVAGALAPLGDARAVVPLVERLQDPQFQNPKLIKDTTLALGGLLGTLQQENKAIDAAACDAAVTEVLRQLKTSPNDTVRKAAAEALGLCKAVGVKDVLIEEFKAALQSGQEELARALKQAVAAIDPEEESRLTDLEMRTGSLWSQRRRQTLLDDEREVSKRLQAARELGEYRDVRGLKASRMVASSATVPPKLREACLQSIQQIVPESS